MRLRALHLSAGLVFAGALACSSSRSSPSSSADATPTQQTEASSQVLPMGVEAGFLEVPARNVTVKGQRVSIAATARLFYNLRAADESPETKPILILFNGFADDIVRAFGTGPATVAPSGAIVSNASSLTSLANLVYVEPRQAGYSYDVLASGNDPTEADCSASIFNEYVDAADMLFAVLAFLEAHPSLTGPVYWLGESYAGVRITWILTYLRGRWSNVPYADPLLSARVASVHRSASLFAGQILLEAWLAGGAEEPAVEAECEDPVEVAGLSASLGMSCGGMDACSCATSYGRALYNYEYTESLQNLRDTQADVAHTDPGLAAQLLGVKLTDIPLLAASERRQGFKCATADDTVPPETALAALLGALPRGQSYYLPYSVLSSSQTSPMNDWATLGYEPVAFADNLHDVPAFLSQGDRDLVVPTRALAPALRAELGKGRVDTSSPGRLGLTYPDGERYIDIFEYTSAGHMIEMVEPAKLASDLTGWLAASSAGASR